MDPPSSLASPQLWDLLAERVLPGLEIGHLASLRGTCRCLRHMLDHDLCHAAWSAAAEHEFPEAQTSCQQQQQQQQQQPASHLSQSCRIQESLRSSGALLQRLRGPGEVSHWPLHHLFEIKMDAAKWSPCSRWVATMQMTRARWRITVFDTLTKQKLSLTPDPDHPIVHMQWLQQTGWLLYVTEVCNHLRPRTKRMLVCYDVVNARQHKARVKEDRLPLGAPFIATSLAHVRNVVAWVTPEATVALLDLPSLQQKAVLCCSDPSFKVSRVLNVLLSPNAAWVTIRWQGRQPGCLEVCRLLDVFDVSTGHVSSIKHVPWDGRLTWSPTSDRILVVCDKDFNERWRMWQAWLMDIASGRRVRLQVGVESRSTMLVAVWMPDGRSIIMQGIAMDPRSEQLCRGFHLFRLDGTVAHSWTHPSGGQSHPLDPSWSEGVPNNLPPFHASLAYFCSQLPPQAGNGPFSEHRSPCGRILAVIPTGAKKYCGNACQQPSTEQAFSILRCGHRVRPGAGKHRTIVWQGTQGRLLTWHPQPALSHVCALLLDSTQIMLVDGKAASVLHIHTPSTLQNAGGLSLKRSQPWHALQWSPDGTKLCLAGVAGVSVIAYMQAEHTVGPQQHAPTVAKLSRFAQLRFW